MKKTIRSGNIKYFIRSSNPKHFKWALNYTFLGLLPFFVLGVFMVEGRTVEAIIFIVVFFVALFCYLEFYIKKMPLVQIAQKAHQVSIYSHLFIEVDQQKIPFDQIERVEFIGSISPKMIASKVFSITLNKTHQTLENPIIFIEWRAGLSPKNLKSNPLSYSKVATKIQELIYSRNQ